MILRRCGTRHDIQTATCEVAPQTLQNTKKTSAVNDFSRLITRATNGTEQALSAVFS
jgi:hypothetical protein